MPFWPDRFHFATIRSGTGEVPFDPLEIAALGEWFDFRLLSAGLVDGDPIDSLTGRKGVYTLEQTGTARPTWAADDGDGFAAMQFDGVDDNLACTIDNYTLYGSTGSYEIWFVLKGLSAGLTDRGYWGSNFGTRATALRAITSPNRLSWLDGAGGTSDTANIQDDQWHIVRHVSTAGQKKWVVDGVDYVVTTIPGGWPSGVDFAKLGFDWSSNYWHGSIRHAMFFTEPLDNATAGKMATYLGGAK